MEQFLFRLQLFSTSKEKFKSVADKKILLVGTGKIGRNTCKNLVDYLGTKNITLINRSVERSFLLAAEMGLMNASFENLKEQIEAGRYNYCRYKCELNQSSAKRILNGLRRKIINRLVNTE